MHVKRILVPIDFSDLSRRTLVDAAGLARSLDASVTALHVHEHVDMPVVDPAFRPPDDRGNQPKIIANLKQQLEALLEPLNLPGDRKQARVEVGNPVDGIVEVSGEHDLVVLATHGSRGVGRYLLGTVTERVLKGAQCSAMVVRGGDEG